MRASKDAYASHDITAMLRDWNAGNQESLDRLIPLVYQELRHIAGGYLKGAPRDATLGPTALINEVYLGLANGGALKFDNRAMFFGFAARMIRLVILKHAREQMALKRGGDCDRLHLDEAVHGFGERTPDMATALGMEEALTRLEAIDTRKTRIVELRFFVGLNVEETARVLNVSPTTVKNEWRAAKRWLAFELKNKSDNQAACPGARSG